MKAMQVGVGLFLMAFVAGLSAATAAAQQTSGAPTTAAAEVTQCAQAQMAVDQLLAAGMQRLDSARQSNAAADLRAAVDSVQNTMRDARAQLAACAATTPAAPMDHSKMPMGAAPMAMPATGAKPPVPAPMDHSKMPIGNAPAAKPATGAKPSAPAPMVHSKMPMRTPPAAKPDAVAKPPAPAPMDHTKMGKDMAPADAAAQAVDPVCGLKVDLGAAPRATHQGRTHYFCSEQHRDVFQKNPSKYLPKGK